MMTELTALHESCIQAASFHRTREYQKAESAYRDSLARSETIFGANSRCAAAILNNLAGVYQIQGRLEEAEAMYLKALQMKRMLFGAGHPHVATAAHNLAVLYHKMRRYTEADALYRRSLAILRQTLERSDPRLYLCERNYRRLLRAMKPQPFDSQRTTILSEISTTILTVTDPS